MRPQAKCHPERPHYAHGLCAYCYKRKLYERNPKALRRARRTSRAWWLRNREKVLAGQRKRYAANLRAERDRAYGYRLRAKFGISIEQYLAMLRAQDSRCAICRTPQGEHVRLALDHCHASGKLRALLCSRCNTTLGSVEDSAELLDRMAAYLRRY